MNKINSSIVSVGDKQSSQRIHMASACELNLEGIVVLVASMSTSLSTSSSPHSSSEKLFALFFMRREGEEGGRGGRWG